MAEQHLPLRATGLARALGMLVLLAGIVAMHAAVFAVPGHADATISDHAAMVRTRGPVAEETGGVAWTVAASSATTPVGHRVAEIAGTDDQARSAMPIAIAEPITLTDINHGAPGADCAGDGCDGAHGGMHGCVFILTAVALLLALVLLYRIAVDRPGNDVARLCHWRPRRERSPPWTVLSLAELSILRI
ncbi:DUF6153 family protein [Nocardia sp. NPDC051052]|uniref:DUF6153 family protein n=1 Tax=Nocardia sp. NPDC051052 TaxID=3364322 RepID=UPI0037A1F350